MSDDGRKIFVGGLGPTTTFQSLGAAFSTFGDIVESNVIMDKVTGNSKGYGFVIFVEAENAQQAVAEGFVSVDGKNCNCNISSLGNQLTNKRGKGQTGGNDGNNGNNNQNHNQNHNNNHNNHNHNHNQNHNQNQNQNQNQMMGNNNNYHPPYLNEAEAFKGQVTTQLQSMYVDIQSVKFEISLLNGSINQIKQTMFSMKQSLDTLILQGATNTNNASQPNSFNSSH
jgi:RNA recognition motif-containing protein